MPHCGEKLPIAGDFRVGPLQHAKAVWPDVDRVMVSSYMLGTAVLKILEMTVTVKLGCM
jgi:hypothetical protein